MSRAYSIEEIVNMYNEIESEEHYDSDDISTMICEQVIIKGNMSGNQEYFRFIYDIFDICKNHIHDTQQNKQGEFK